MEYLLEMWPLLLGMAVLFGSIVWWQKSSEKREESKHAKALTALASSLGGTVTSDAAAWSADLRGPLANDVGGLVNTMGTVRRPRFTTALDFQRGRWHVRVTEAAMKKSTSTSSRWIHEHRIEVATVRLAPLKITRRQHAPENGWVSEMPATAAHEQADWMKVDLPEELDREFIVFTSDLSSAPRVLNPQSIEWLRGQTGSVSMAVRMFMALTFESGFVYMTTPSRIEPENVVPAVDAIVGLLDRIPGAMPRHPATTA